MKLPETFPEDLLITVFGIFKFEYLWAQIFFTLVIVLERLVATMRMKEYEKSKNVTLGVLLCIVQKRCERKNDGSAARRSRSLFQRLARKLEMKEQKSFGRAGDRTMDLLNREQEFYHWARNNCQPSAVKFS
ncbi:unnamed protein product [Caenorhabditis auriculariae]|uniref:Uncharacterized protein n=1 Tax=Caenorhabditis auriculariae TaxID=2777116 RepID=A0A8S1GUE1_9PELO|nr:unnamed protein product [Caenorhabditis auriculariae]